MKPYQLVWTMGAAGTSKTSNWNNWYRRSTGLHQLLMGCFEATELGCFEARLSQVSQLTYWIVYKLTHSLGYLHVRGPASPARIAPRASSPRGNTRRTHQRCVCP